MIDQCQKDWNMVVTFYIFCDSPYLKTNFYVIKEEAVFEAMEFLEGNDNFDLLNMFCITR